MKKTLLKKNSRSLIKKYLRDFNSKNIFVVTGKNSFKTSGAKQYILEELSNFNLTFLLETRPRRTCCRFTGSRTLRRMTIGSCYIFLIAGAVESKLTFRKLSMAPAHAQQLI